jgi:hypothetical protein
MVERFDLPCFVAFFVAFFVHAAGLVEIDIAQGQANDQGADLSAMALPSQQDAWLRRGDTVEPWSLGNKALQRLSELSGHLKIASQLRAALYVALHDSGGSAGVDIER